MTTNNVAEYTALIEGLQMSLDKGVTDLDVYIDSPVVAGHFTERAQDQSGSPASARRAGTHLLGHLSTSSLVRVPRELNTDADILANRGIDEAISEARSGSPWKVEET